MEVVRMIVHWQNALLRARDLDITFHGGEPLLAGAEFFKMALPTLQEGLSANQVSFNLQSNLWLLTAELCELFREYGVSVGTSLDGPEQINDAQRGEGYFKRTKAGLELAQSYGLPVGCICSFTPQSMPYVDEIIDFFVSEGLDLSIHASVPSLQHPHVNNWALSPKEHGKFLVQLVDRYREDVDKIRISTLDSLCRSISRGHSDTCTFRDCLGEFLAVGPKGDIYPCQRFAGMGAYRLGNVSDGPSMETLAETPVWRGFQKRQARIRDACRDCPSFDFCKGGCPYNVLAAENNLDDSPRDPFCSAYRQVFAHITELSIEEVFYEENLTEVVNRPDGEKGFLRKGKLLSIMNDGPHPHDVAQAAREVLAAVALGATNGPLEAFAKFEELGLVRNPERTRRGIAALHRRLSSPASGVNNLYLHVTFDCPLRCTHCYAKGGRGNGAALPVEDLSQLCVEAAEIGFRHAVITGGEPLVHPKPNELLEALSGLRKGVKPLLTVLRTSFVLPMDDDLMERVACSTDEVVVSVDGDRETHDARRGHGSYDRTVGNLRSFCETGYETDLSLAAVLPREKASGPAGDAVRHLAHELGIERTRFRPVLPIGGALEGEANILPEPNWGHGESAGIMTEGFTPTASCGIGQNLYVEPDGSAYPCYAWHGERWMLGHINHGRGLAGVIGSDSFQSLGRHTVDTNRRCRACTLRYLCGGACRAWNRQPQEDQTDLDGPLEDCSPLHGHARMLLLGALELLGIPAEHWLGCGLPLPGSPPSP